MRPRCPALPIALLALLVLAGCRDNQVKTYRIPAERPAQAAAGTGTSPAPTSPEPAAASGGTMASTPVPTAGGDALVWTAPASWQTRAASAMRKGTFIIPGEGDASAELAITAFPGDVGGDLANVNRWRGQLRLAPIAAAELSGALERFEANGLQFAVADMTATGGNTPDRVLGAIVPHAGSTWFFKLTGPEPLVAREKQAFLEFLRTVRAP